MFRRVLIANRGEVAVRVARACRALGIAPIGVASEADFGAAWTGEMDEIVCLGPAAAAASYLDPVRIVQAARQTHASAIHPGWGFLAENPLFAALCRQHGVTFIGPSASVIERMGVKSPAKAAMRGAGLPVVPGSTGLLPDLESAIAAAREVGFPVMLKADRGGGGRGMRRCDDEPSLREAYAAARAEAEAAFGDGEIYLEKLLEGGRHIEVQILCDAYGRGIHLGERDCSVQRKHQKLIEESPSPALGAVERAALGDSAVRAALALGYTNAGTIEFLRARDGAIYFMEMNTRLQVEHPVSEMISGVDIVEQQLRIAAHQPLALEQHRVELSGAAIECRINAEDPAAGFRPSPGRLHTFDLPCDVGPGRVRVETHLSAGEDVSPHYDSLLAKVVAHGETRAAAIETMLACLRAARVEGVATTIPLHLQVLGSDAFRRGEYDTSAIPGWSETRGS